MLPAPATHGSTTRLRRLRERATRLADEAPDLLGELASWVPLAAAICVAPGVAAVPIVARQLGYLQTNRLPIVERLQSGAVVLGVAFLLGLVYARRLRRRAPGERVATAAARLNRLLSPLLFLPVLVWMAPEGGEAERPFFELALVAAVAAWSGVLAYRARPRAGAPPAWAAAATALGLGALHVAVIGFYALRHHRALGTATYDLGIYDNVMWNSAHGRPLATTVLSAGSHLAGHFDPVLLLLAPLYRLAPGAETLLVLQVVWLALGAVPLWWLARDTLGRPWVATAVCAAYLLHPALHGASLFDFHSLTLAIPLLIAAVWLLQSGRLRAYAAVVALLLLVREDVSLLVVCLGTWAALTGRPRAGLASMAAGLAYFAVVRLAILGHGVLNEGGGPEVESFAYYYDALIPDGMGSAGVLLSLLGNPAFALAHAFSAEKMRYLAVMFVPLAFVPLFAPRAGWLLLFGLGATLLASKEAVYSPYYQYVTTVLPFAVALVPLGLARLRDGRALRLLGLDRDRVVRALSVALVVAAIFTSADFGAIFGNASFRAGSRGLRRRWSPEVAERWRAVEDAAARIGPEASVSATRYVLPHVSARDEIAEFPRPEGADFLLLQTEDLDAHQRGRLRALERTGAYHALEKRGGIELWQRAPEVAAPPPGSPEPAAGPAAPPPPRR